MSDINYFEKKRLLSKSITYYKIENGETYRWTVSYTNFWLNITDFQYFPKNSSGQPDIGIPIYAELYSCAACGNTGIPKNRAKTRIPQKCPCANNPFSISNRLT